MISHWEMTLQHILHIAGLTKRSLALPHVAKRNGVAINSIINTKKRQIRMKLRTTTLQLYTARKYFWPYCNRHRGKVMPPPPNNTSGRKSFWADPRLSVVKLVASQAGQTEVWTGVTTGEDPRSDEDERERVAASRCSSSTFFCSSALMARSSFRF